MILLLLACATTPPAPAAPPPDPNAKVRAYAQDVSRICAEREPEIIAAAQASCQGPSMGAQMAAEAVSSWYAAAYPLKPEEVGRRPQLPVVCEPDPPEGLGPMSPATEPEVAPDPKLAAIGQAALRSEEARQSFEADPSDVTRREWTLALGSLQQLCVDFPSG
jgi:hypothetical protein